MNELERLIAHFNTKKAEIEKLNAEYKAKMNEAKPKFQERVDAIDEEYKQFEAEARRDLDNARETYKAEMKAAFGVADGEDHHVLSVVELFKKALACSTTTIQ